MDHIRVNISVAHICASLTTEERKREEVRDALATHDEQRGRQGSTSRVREEGDITQAIKLPSVARHVYFGSKSILHIHSAHTCIIHSLTNNSHNFMLTRRIPI